MTIRRHVDLTAVNSLYTDFEAGVDAAPEGTFSQCRNLKFEIGEACDDWLRSMKRIGVTVCNCDGIREIELMMFDNVLRNGLTGEMEAVIGLGRTLREHPEEKDRVIAGLERDRDFLRARDEEPDLNDDEDQYAPTPILGNVDY